MTMTTKAIDKKLRVLFPEVFTFLDEHHLRVGGQVHWVLAVKSGTSMAISSTLEPSGEDVMMTRHPKGKKWGTQNVYFATRINIPENVWAAWDKTVAHEEDGSDSEESDIIEYKGKGRHLKRARSPSPSGDEADETPLSPKRQASSSIGSRALVMLGEDDEDDIEIMAGVGSPNGPDNPAPLFTAASPEDTPNENGQHDFVDLTDDYFVNDIADDFPDFTSDFGIHPSSSTSAPLASTSQAMYSGESPSNSVSISSEISSSTMSVGSRNTLTGLPPPRSGFRLATPKRKAWQK